MKLLEGYRLLDFSRILAGPQASMILGDLGMDVIKVEPLEGDTTRHWGPPFYTLKNGEKVSTYFAGVNRNKKSIAIDLKTKEGQTIVHSLARVSQMAIENFSPGVSSRLNIDYETLKQLNPLLVYLSINSYGTKGPMRSLSGFDAAIQAYSGLMSVTGPVESPPHKVGVAITDVLTGLYSTIGLLSGLIQALQVKSQVNPFSHLFQTQPIWLYFLLERQRKPHPNIAFGIGIGFIGQYFFWLLEHWGSAKEIRKRPSQYRALWGL